MTLEIVDLEADRRFRALAGSVNPDVDALWLGGYAQAVWDGRDLITAYAHRFAGARVLEFGCNVGGTCITPSRLGSRVTAVDINSRRLSLAELNAARYGAGRGRP